MKVEPVTVIGLSVLAGSTAFIIGFAARAPLPDDAPTSVILATILWCLSLPFIRAPWRMY